MMMMSGDTSGAGDDDSTAAVMVCRARAYRMGFLMLCARRVCRLYIFVENGPRRVMCEACALPVTPLML